MADNKRKLYDALQGDYELGTYEQFDSLMNDEANRRKLYDAASEKYDLGDNFDSFNEILGYTAKPVEPTEPAQAAEKKEVANEFTANVPNYYESMKSGNTAHRTEEPAQTEGEPLTQTQKDSWTFGAEMALDNVRKAMSGFSTDEDRMNSSLSLLNNLSSQLSRQKQDKRQARKDGDKELKGAYKSAISTTKEEIERIGKQLDLNPEWRKRLDTESAVVNEKKNALRDITAKAYTKVKESYGGSENMVYSTPQTDPMVASAEAANRLYDDALQTINAPMRFDESSGIANFGEGMLDDMKNPDFWTLGLTDISDKMALRGALEALVEKAGSAGDDKIENIDQYDLPDEQKALLDAFMTANAAKILRAVDTSKGYENGINGAESLKFFAEMALTGGLGKQVAGKILDKLGKAGTDKLIGRISANLFEKVSTMAPRTFAGKAGKFAATKLGKLTRSQMESLIGSGVMTLAQPLTLENIGEELTSVNERGELQSRAKSIIRGISSQYKETLTEKSGGIIDSTLNSVGQAISGTLRHTRKEAVLDALKTANARILASKIGAFYKGANALKKAGWDNFGEYFEELLGAGIDDVAYNLTNGYLGNGSNSNVEQFFDVEGLLDMTATFAPMAAIGLGFGGARLGKSIHYGNKLKKTENALRYILEPAGMDKRTLDNFFAKYQVALDDNANENGISYEDSYKITAHDMALDFSAMFRDYADRKAAEGSPVSEAENKEILRRMTEFVKDYQSALTMQGLDDADLATRGEELVKEQTDNLGRAITYSGNKFPNAEVVTCVAIDGREGFVQSEDENGDYYVVFSDDARPTIISGGLLESITPFAAGEYGKQLATQEKQAKEQERISAQTAGQLDAVREKFNQQYGVQSEVPAEVMQVIYENAGKAAYPADSKSFITAIGEDFVEIGNENGAVERFTWDQIAPLYNVDIQVETDADIANREAQAYDADDAMKEDIGYRVNQAIQEGIVLEESGEQIVEIFPDTINVNDGTVKATLKFGDETRIGRINYQEILDKMQTPAEPSAPGAEQVSETVQPEGQAVTPDVQQTPDYEVPMTEDGEVDWNRMLVENPEEFATRFDELNGGDSTNTIGALTARVKELEGERKKIKPTDINSQIKKDRQIKAVNDVLDAYKSREEEEEARKKAEQEASDILTKKIAVVETDVNVLNEKFPTWYELGNYINKAENVLSEFSESANEEQLASIDRKLRELEETRISMNDVEKVLPDVSLNTKVVLTKEDLEPQTPIELAAYLLSNGKIYLNYESYKRETGHNATSREYKNLIGLFRRGKEGKTIDEIGEIIEAEAGGGGYIGGYEGTPINTEQTSGRDVVLELLSQVKTRGDITDYIKNVREEQKMKEGEAVESEIDNILRNSFGVGIEDYVEQLDANRKQLLAAELGYSSKMPKFVQKDIKDGLQESGTGTNDEVPEVEQGSSANGDTESGVVLQGEQPDDTEIAGSEQGQTDVGGNNGPDELLAGPGEETGRKGESVVEEPAEPEPVATIEPESVEEEPQTELADRPEESSAGGKPSVTVEDILDEKPKEAVKEEPKPEVRQEPSRLTEDEIRNSGFNDEDMIDAAVDFVNGLDDSIPAKLAYNTIEEYVRNKSNTGKEDSGAANGTQLDGRANETGTLGDRGGRGESSEMGGNTNEGQRREADSVQGGTLPFGVEGNREVQGTELGPVRTDSGNDNSGRRGGNNERRNERNVQQGKSGGGNETPIENTGRTVEAGSTNIDALAGELNDLLDEFANSGLDSTSKSIVEPKAQKLQRVNRSIAEPETENGQKDNSLSRKRVKKPTLPLSLDGMTMQQQVLASKILFSSAKLGYANAKTSGLTTFEDFRRWFKTKFGKPIMEKLNYDESSLESFIYETWNNTKLKIDGARLTLSDFVSEMRTSEILSQPDIPQKIEWQKKANGYKGEIKHADRNNIKETVPVLTPGQWDDVVAIERQLFDETHNDYDHAFGKGMLVTNGTGTGKTFTGLGVIKRAILDGKKRILLVCPAGMREDWTKTAKLFGLDLNILDNMKDKGKGFVCTSYQNFSRNKALLEDTFDLIVYDECQNIIENQKGDETLAYDAHKMLTNKNVQSATDRLLATTKEGKQKEALLDEKAKLEKEEKKASGNRAAEIIIRKEEIDNEVEQLESQLSLIRPTLKDKAKEAVKKTKVLLLSATPFNQTANTKIAEGIAFNYPKVFKADGTENTDETARYASFVADWFSGENREQDEIDFGDHLLNDLETNTFRELENGHDFSRDFPHAGGMVNHELFNQAWEALMNDRRFAVLREHAKFLLNYAWSSQLFETMKASAIKDRMDEHLSSGRKIVLFHNRLHETITDGKEKMPPVGPPFRTVLETALFNGKDPARVSMAISQFEKDFKQVLDWEQTLDYRPVPEQIIDFYATAKDRAEYQKKKDQYDKELAEWTAKYNEKLQQGLSAGKTADEAVAGFPNPPKEPKLEAESICLYNGECTNKQKEEAKAQFNDDNGNKKIIIVTTRSGGAGLSLHDTTGKFPRVMIQTSLPNSPIGFIQAEGRVFRYGNKSNAAFEYPLLGINLETILFASSFNTKVGTTENLAHGSRGRGFKESIMTGFWEDSGNIPIAGQGIGGVEKDRRGSTLKGMAKAKHDYSVVVRKGIRSKDKSIPEPLGYKMAQLGGLTAGEDALVPFAGRGSIARYMEKGVRLVALEKDAGLLADLAVVAGGPDTKLRDDISFDELNPINKADAVFLNGQYDGKASDAIESLDKAFQLLNEGGRIVAVVPKDERLDKFVPQATKRMTILVPDGILGEKGSDMRIIVIDKISSQKLRDKASYKEIDLRNASNENDFFNLLDSIVPPERIIDKEAIRIKKVKSSLPDFKKLDIVESCEMFSSGREDNKSFYVSFVMKPKKGFGNARFDIDNILPIRPYYKSYKYFSVRMNEFVNPTENSQTVRQYMRLKEVTEYPYEEFAKWVNAPSDAKPEAVEELRQFYKSMMKLYRNAFGLNDAQITRISNGLQADVSVSDIGDLNTLETLREKFQTAIGDNEEALEGFEKVYKAAVQAGINVETYAEQGNFLGEYNNIENKLRINKLGWNRSNDRKRADVLLHELIHSVTVYGIVAADYGNQVNPEVAKAGKLINDVFANLTIGSPEDVYPFRGYMIENAKELVAQMFEENKTDKLKERPMWVARKGDMVFVSGRELQGEGIEKTTAFDLLNEALTSMVQNFDKDAFDRFRSRTSDIFWSLDNRGNLVESGVGEPLPKDLRFHYGSIEAEKSTDANEIMDAIEQIGVSLKTRVIFHESAPDKARIINGRKVEPKGWYDARDGRVHINLAAINDMADAQATLFHEAVGHYGLRKLFGKDFDAFLDNVYDNAEQNIRKTIDRISKDMNLSRRAATEEYLAMLAEDGPSDIQEQSFFKKVKEFFFNMLRSVGVKIENAITDADLRYVLWMSRRNLETGNDDVLDNAEKAINGKNLKYEAENSHDLLDGAKKVSSFENSESTEQYSDSRRVGGNSDGVSGWRIAGGLVSQLPEEGNAWLGGDSGLVLRESLAATRKGNSEGASRKPTDVVVSETQNEAPIQSANESDAHFAERCINYYSSIYNLFVPASIVDRSEVLLNGNIIDDDTYAGYSDELDRLFLFPTPGHTASDYVRAIFHELVHASLSRSGIREEYSRKFVDFFLRQAPEGTREVLNEIREKYGADEVVNEEFVAGMMEQSFVTDKYEKMRNFAVRAGLEEEFDRIFKDLYDGPKQGPENRGEGRISRELPSVDSRQNEGGQTTYGETGARGQGNEVAELSVPENERYRIVDDKATLRKLNEGPVVKVYRAMQKIADKLYPPMSAKVDGKYREPIELGKWEEAEETLKDWKEGDELPANVIYDKKSGKLKYRLDKGNGKTVDAAYNPYFHTSRTPLNDQFSSAQDRPELVTVEVEVPESELTSGYTAKYAKDSTGELDWKAGVLQGKLSGTRKVILSRWDKPVRVVPDSEVADVIVKMFEGKNIVFPSNVVTPSLRSELEKRGIRFRETNNQGKPTDSKNTVLDEILSQAKDVFGTTRNIKEAGYLLPDGSMLDFSGSKFGGGSGRRSIDHRELKVYGVDSNMNDFMNRGAIRLGPESATIDISVKPTSEQMSALYGYINKFNGEVILEISGANGESLAYAEYDEKTSPMKVIGDIRDYFDSGIEPTGNSIMYSFGNSESYKKLKANPSRASRLLSRIHTTNEEYGVARHYYDVEVARPANILFEQYVDQYMSVIKAIEGIEKESGRKAEKAEDFRLLATTVSSKNKHDHDVFRKEHLVPMNKAVAAITELPGFDYDDVVRYVEMKHGIERNIEMSKRSAWSDYINEYEQATRPLLEENVKLRKKMDALIKKAGSYDDLPEAALEKYEGYKGQIEDNEEQISNLSEALSLHKKALFPADYYKEKHTEALDAVARDASLTHAEKESKREAINAKYNAIFEDINNNPKKYELLRDADTKFAAYRGLDGESDGTDFAAIRSWFAQYSEDGTPLSETPAKFAYETKAEYNSRLASMRTIPDNAKKITDAEKLAEEWIANFEEKVGDELVNNLWDKINGATHAIRKHQLDHHTISREQYDNLETRYKYYVPLRGFADDTARDLWDYGSEDHSKDFAAPLIVARGRNSKPAAPFAYIGTMFDSANLVDNQNTLRQALYRFVAARKDNSLITIADSWYVPTGEKNENDQEIWEPVYPQITADMSLDEQKEVVDQFEAEMTERAAAGMAIKGSKGLNLRKAVANIDSKDKDKHIVKVMWLGKEKFLIFNSNPRAAMAINGELNVEALTDNKALDFARSITRLMAVMNTGASPSFWAANFMKDFWTGLFNVSINEDAKYLKDYASNREMVTFCGLKAIMNDGEFVDNPKWNDRIRKKAKEINRLYKLYLENGGPTGFSTITHLDEYEAEIKKLTAQGKDEALAKCKAVWDGFMKVGKIGEALEQVPRFAVFVTSYKAGRGIEQSVNDAKDVTLNFNRKGAASGIKWDYTKQLQALRKNGTLRNLTAPERVAVYALANFSPIARSFYMFFNPAVQGVDKMIRNAKSNPKKFAAIGLGAVFSYGLVRALISSMFDDDDDTSYNELNDYRKRHNVILKVKGIDVLMPFSQEYAPIMALGDIAANVILKRYGPNDSPTFEALDAMASILPINPLEPSQLMPSALSPVVDVMTNRNFMGSEIYHDWASNKNDPSYTKAPSNTWDWLVDFSQWANDATGGTYAKKGFIDINPAVAQHLIEGIGGGLLRDIGNAAQTVDAIVGDSEWKVRTTPVLNRFILNPEEYRNAYVYDKYEQFKQIADETHELERKYSDDPFNLSELLSSKDYEYYEIIQEYNSELKELNNERKSAQTYDEKKAAESMIDAIKQEIVERCMEVFYR